MGVRVWTSWIGVALLLAAGSARAEEIKAYGLTIVPWSAKVGDDRFRSPRDFRDTVKYYDKMFLGWKNVKKHREVNLPGIKYVHYENTNADSKWSGFNVYQAGPQGEVRIYVLRRIGDRDGAAGPKKPKRKPKKSG
ncbi:MAG: hypothetical protein JXR83_22040 [Deltaproteobacteria bacterium]|nr:hypothetical protein [Deltaproteobacteria bacterium]